MVEDLKQRILNFNRSARSMSRAGDYAPENWYTLKAESMKYSTKREYNKVIHLLSYWFREHNENIYHYKFIDMIILGNDVFIYTQQPGKWIGKKAETLNDITNRLNIDKHNVKVNDYTIHLIEDKDSAQKFMNFWINYNY